MSLQYRTVDQFARVYEVTDLVDRFAAPTTDPALATACVIKVDADHLIPIDTDDVPIYTVH